MHKYEIVMAEPAYRKMMTLVDLMDGEIAALGYCEPMKYIDSEDGYLYVKEIHVCPQVASSAEVDFINEGLGWFVEKAMKEDRINEARFCFHSHGNMSEFWSGTDEDMIAKMGLGGTPWFASVVVNKKGKMKGRIDVFDSPIPGLGQMTQEAIVVCETDMGLIDECRAEIKEHVKKPVEKWKAASSGYTMYPNTPPHKEKGKQGSKAPAKDKTRQGKGKSKRKADADKVANIEVPEGDIDEMLKEWVALHDMARKMGWTEIRDDDNWVMYVEDMNGTVVEHGTAPALDALQAAFGSKS